MEKMKSSENGADILAKAMRQVFKEAVEEGTAPLCKHIDEVCEAVRSLDECVHALDKRVDGIEKNMATKADLDITNRNV